MVHNWCYLTLAVASYNWFFLENKNIYHVGLSTNAIKNHKPHSAVFLCGENMSWYKTGTIAATNGSKIITGTGTQFTNPLNGVSVGRMLLLPSAGTVQIYEIESVQSDTQLTLVSAFTGTTGTGKAYAIPTSPAVSIEQFANEFASTLAYYQQQLSGWQQILTGAGNVTLTTPDGQAVTVRSQQAWDDTLNGKVTGVKQTGPFDATAGSLLINGAWGWGAKGRGFTRDEAAMFDWLKDSANGSQVYRNDTGNVAYGLRYAPSLLLRAGDLWSSISFGHEANVGNPSFGIRATIGNEAGTVATVHNFWTDRNLIKQASSTDASVGRVLTLASEGGAFGLGGIATRMPANLNVADYLRSVPTGFYAVASTADTVGLPTPVVVGAGYMFHLMRYNTNPLAIVTASLIGGGMWRGTLGATGGINWLSIWDSANLVKQSSEIDTTSGAMLINEAFGLGAQASKYIVGSLNDATRNGFFRYTAGTTGAPSSVAGFGIMFGFDTNTQAQLVSPAGENGIRFRRKGGGGWLAWTTLLDQETAQTVTAIKTHNAAVVTANAVAFRGTYTDGTVKNLAHINAQNIVHIGDGAAPTTIHGSAMPLIQVGAGTAYEIVDAGTSQTISGEKIFTGRSIFQNNGRAIYLVDPNIAVGTLGRSFDISGTITGSDPRFVFAQRTNPGVGAGQTYVDLPVKNTGKVLVTNNNVTVDSNGFIKTASPVVKLFANGTSEAEGITSERLSEGVYRISGCLGLNADRAWGGDDGGIDVPMCRNKLPRLWVDYGGDEGNSQINPDGSIVIRTYHRPHPDAPVFARNEIEGYANGDPIDIPHDTFISVRVQMPEAEVQEAVVETVPNAVERDIVLETATQV